MNTTFFLRQVDQQRTYRSLRNRAEVSGVGRGRLDKHMDEAGELTCSVHEQSILCLGITRLLPIIRYL